MTTPRNAHVAAAAAEIANAATADEAVAIVDRFARLNITAEGDKRRTDLLQLRDALGDDYEAALPIAPDEAVPRGRNGRRAAALRQLSRLTSR